MALRVETKDCTALSDAEVAEMADICADGAAGYDVGILSKHCEQWVLITQVRDGTDLSGFSFSTLERIGGTPSVLVGLASVKRTANRAQVLRALVGDQLRRAVLAFPDEDVLVGTRLLSAGAFAAFEGLLDIVPRPGHKASGEERAWGRRLAKRFGAEGKVDDRTFVLAGTGDPPAGLDYESLATEAVDLEVASLFEGLDEAQGDSVIAFGWAMAEDLARRVAK
ncbi:MAG: hypothetical protein ACRD0Q_09995 [Acidimicrobiales bacterium]